jgi:hypothetical protein
MAQLIVVGFKKDMYRASEVLNELQAMDDDWVVDLHDAVAVYRDYNGKLRVDHRSGSRRTGGERSCRRRAGSRRRRHRRFVVEGRVRHPRRLRKAGRGTDPARGLGDLRTSAHCQSRHRGRRVPRIRRHDSEHNLEPWPAAEGGKRSAKPSGGIKPLKHQSLLEE